MISGTPVIVADWMDVHAAVEPVARAMAGFEDIETFEA